MLLWFARGYPDVVERLYSRGAFPVIQGLLAWVHRSLPLSLSEILIGVVGLVAGYQVGAGFYGCLAGRRRLMNLLMRWLVVTMASAGALTFGFFALWGLNHARPPLADLAGLDVSPATEAELRALTGRLHGEALSALSAGAGSGPPAGCVDWSGGDGGAELEAAWAVIALQLPFLSGPGPRVRPAALSPVLSWLGLSGVYSPFSGEPHVNAQMPGAAQPFTACHEVAHQRGLAREDEANFIAWLVCRESADPGHRYSGSLIALSYALGAWHREHSPDSAPALVELDPRIRADLEALHRFWSSRHGPLSKLATVGHDAVLRGLGHEHGVRSYGGVVDLLIGWERRHSE